MNMNLPSNNQIVNHEKMASEKKNVIYYVTNFENDLAQTVEKNGKSPESPELLESPESSKSLKLPEFPYLTL